jgi:hypothetical protein
VLIALVICSPGVIQIVPAILSAIENKDRRHLNVGDDKVGTRSKVFCTCI